DGCVGAHDGWSYHGWCHGFRRGWLRRNRQVDAEGRPVSRRGVHVDGTTMMAHQSVDKRQAKACALTDVFGREKRFEETRANLRRHPEAGIADAQSYALLKGHVAALRRLHRVLADIEVNRD